MVSGFSSIRLLFRQSKTSSYLADKGITYPILDLMQKVNVQGLVQSIASYYSPDIPDKIP
jgi:hypothetical protein